jgi:ABC-2 type transport system permease protein
VNPVRLVARREFTERIHERSFLISTGITLAIVVVVLLLPALLGFGGPNEYTVAAGDPQSRAVVERASQIAGELDVKVTLGSSNPDATVTGGEIRSEDEPPAELVSILQLAAQPATTPPLQVVTTEPVDPDRDAKAGLAFFTILILYGQLLTYGFWVATGVVEEKSSRVIEILLATIRAKDLLAGKVLGLGLLGLGQLLIVSLFGLLVAAATGALDVDGDLLVAVALSLGWFVLGYAFYASAYAVAGAMVPRQEEIQSTTTPLTMLILVSLFAGFAVQDDPDGTFAHVSAFIPPIAPVTMPSRIILGAAPPWEIAASAALMVVATLVMIPVAGRIYSAVVLRTGSAVKFREALRLARAQR